MGFFCVILLHIKLRPDTSLREDPESNAEVLAGGNGAAKLYLGLSAKGKLKHPQYGALYNAIEHSSTFYSFPKPETVTKLAGEVPIDFKFCPKFLRGTTHLKRFREIGNDAQRMVDAMSLLGDKLGPFMVTPHLQMGITEVKRIADFMINLPVAAHLEVRRNDWFEGGFDGALLKMLRVIGKGTVITNTTGRREAVHIHLSNRTAMVRFVCCGNDEADTLRMHLWVNRLMKWKGMGLEEVYFFVHHDEETAAHRYARVFREWWEEMVS